MPIYTFDSFVVRAASREAFNAAVAVAENSSAVHNPLALYGPTRSGKTHLLYAIEKTMRSRRPEAKVVRLPTADFIDRLIDAIRRDTMPDFRRWLAGSDALLLDDIRLIDKPNTTQELFFNLDEALKRGAQVVVTCEVAPRRYSPLAKWLAKNGGTAAALRKFQQHPSGPQHA